MTATAPSARDRLSTLRTATRKVLPVLLVGACVPSALRLVGDHDMAWAVMLVVLLPLWAGLVAVLGIACALFRRRVWAGIAAVVVFVNALWLAPLWIADDPPRSGTRMTAMTANLLYGMADANWVVEQVRERKIDVLALTEVTPEAVMRLTTAGLDALLPHHVIAPGERAHGSGLWARWPLTRTPDWEGGVHNWPGAMARIDGQDVTLRVVHPFRIARFNSDLYRADNRALRARMDRLGEDDAPALVLGDFNATRDQAAFRGMLGGHWRDASEYAGSGWSPTWNLLTWLPPVIQLDHILMSRQFGAHATRTLDVPGSDHDAMLADLVLAPR
jgi:endonuclease/exonuclease/phosphatase family metal-dependent hydrolase